MLIQDDSLSKGIEAAGSALGKALQKSAEARQKTNQKREATSAINTAFAGLGPNSSMSDIQRAYTQALNTPNADPQQVTEFFKAMSPLYRESLKQQDSAGIIDDIFGPQPQFTPQDGIGPVSQQDGVSPTGQQQPQTISTMPEGSLVRLSAHPNERIRNVAEMELKRRDVARRRFETDRDYHTKETKDVTERASKIRNSLGQKKFALSMSRAAQEDGKIGAFSLDNLAKRLDMPELMTAKGAQLTIAAKENLLQNIARLSGKGQNQWIEKSMSEMFPMIGRSEASNETIQTMLESEVDLDQAFLDAYDELASQDKQRLGYIDSATFNDRLQAKLQPIEQDIINKAAYKTREIYERQQGPQWVEKHAFTKVEKGTPLTMQAAKRFVDKYEGDMEKALKNAEKLGYRVPTRQEVQRWGVVGGR
mgnify:CR=1 FL=1